MTANVAGLVVGGLIPAFLYGLSGIFTKASTNAGLSVGHYLLFTGAAIVATGGAFLWLLPGDSLSLRGGSFAVLTGLTWGCGAGCIVAALLKYGVPIAKLVPLYNMNTLVTVVLAMIVFSEWRDVHAMKLLIGAALICAGGALVSTS